MQYSNQQLYISEVHRLSREGVGYIVYPKSRLPKPGKEDRKVRQGKDIVRGEYKSLGYHIRTLVLKFLLLYCRPLVEQGRVYCALSPLYHINQRKKNWQYFIDKNDFLAYVQDQFMKNYEVTNAKGKKYSKSQLHGIIMRNHPYKDLLKSIADTYAIYPVLLEDILMVRNTDFKKFKKFIESKYRFVTVYQKNGIRIIDGLVNEMSHEVIMSNVILNACAPLLPYIDNSDKVYYVNKRKCGLYELLTIFQESEPKNIDRAKGLGSLNALEIGVSTLDPKNRTLLRYTCEDINREIDEMRKVNDDKFSLIKDIDISQYEF